MRTMQNFPFYDKPMKIQYAKGKSDVIAKLDGTYVPRNIKKGAIKRKAEEPPEGTILQQLSLKTSVKQLHSFSATLLHTFIHYLIHKETSLFSATPCIHS
jgi:hypothetical protein